MTQRATPPQPPAGRGAPGTPAGPTVRAARGHRGRRALLIALASLVGLALVAAGGVFAVRMVFAAHRPAEALPRTCWAYAELNLAPRADQLAALAAFVGNLRPASASDGQQAKPAINAASPKQALFEAVTRGASSKVTWAEVEPWLGDRVGACLVGRTAVLAVQTPKPADAAAALRRITARETSSPFANLQAEQLDGYVLASPERDALRWATAAVRSGETLAKRADFARQAGALDAGTVASFWADAAGYRLVDATESLGFVRGVRIAGTLGFDPAFAALDITLENLPTTRALEGSVRDLVGALPADTTAAAGSASPAALADVASAFAAGSSNEHGLQDYFARLGVSFPTDAEAYAGQAAAIGAIPAAKTLAALVRTADPAATGERLSSAGAAYRAQSCADCTADMVVVTGSDRVALAESGDVATRLVQGGGGLGAFELFGKAVDPRDGAVVAFTTDVEPGDGWPTGADLLNAAGVGRVRAVGLSGSTRADRTGHLTLRYVA